MSVFPQNHADTLTLDLEDSVVETCKTEVRALVKEAIAQVGQGAVEVFVRVNKALRRYSRLFAQVREGSSHLLCCASFTEFGSAP